MKATNTEPTNWAFDVALSFSGEHRSFVRTLSNRLTESGVRVFFDEELQAEMWGENLYDYLQDVYKTKARFVVAFASESYGSKAWPKLERQSAQARALEWSGPYLLPVRLDDSELPGILTTVGYVDAREVGLEGLVSLVLKKLGKEPGANPEDPLPLTQHEMDVLKNDRPPGWEWFLFAGILLQGRSALEDKWRDHILGLKSARAPRLANPQEAIAYIQTAIEQIRVIVEDLGRIISPEVQEKAFGPPGTPGDWDLDEYMGRRFVGLYGQMLSWASEVRSASVPNGWDRVFALLSSYSDQPLGEVRGAIDAFADFARSIPAHVSEPNPSPEQVTIPLKFDIDPETSAAFSAELQKLCG
jgi:hypothetical protein